MTGQCRRKGRGLRGLGFGKELMRLCGKNDFRYFGPRKRKLYFYLFVIVFLGAFLFLAGCQRQKGGLTVAGSTSVEPFAEMLAEDYMEHHGKEKIFIQGGGSSAGIQAVRTGAAHVGMSSRLLTPQEQDLLAFPIAYDAIAVILHPANPLRNLTLAQVRKIFSGEVRRWEEIGGRTAAITLVSREEGSGTREAFQNLLMGKTEISLRALVQDSNGAIRQVVADDPNAIGYISLGLVNEKVKAVGIEGVEATIENIRLKNYKVVRPFLFVFKSEPQDSAKRFLDFVLSEPGQKILVQEGLVSVSALSPPKGEKGKAKGNV
jgi:phosphate transport system substrate-binding protein